MSDLTTEAFYDSAYEKYYSWYESECRKVGGRPSTSDFMVFLDEHNLIPEMDYDHD